MNFSLLVIVRRYPPHLHQSRPAPVDYFQLNST